jgi:hypothetical protein
MFFPNICSYVDMRRVIYLRVGTKRCFFPSARFVPQFKKNANSVVVLFSTGTGTSTWYVTPGYRYFQPKKLY